jgi:hypothetical protein
MDPKSAIFKAAEVIDKRGPVDPHPTTQSDDRDVVEGALVAQVEQSLGYLSSQ